MLKKRVPSNFENKLRQTGEKIFQKLFLWPCNDVVQIDRTLIYDILRATARENSWTCTHNPKQIFKKILSVLDDELSYSKKETLCNA